MMQSHWLTNRWYRRSYLTLALRPVSAVYRLLIGLRRLGYLKGLLTQLRLPVPVIVVGNISVGGTGKTPFVIWLAQTLQQYGWRPGIISRGYGGQAKHYPCDVNFDSLPSAVGDEPLLLRRRTQCPVVVAPDRIAAGRHLLAQSDCNVIIADDGLQHYRLHRDMEVVILDVNRGLGNQACLPAGPLREPVSRLRSVDFIIHHGEQTDAGLSMQLQISRAISLDNPQQQKTLTDFHGQPVHALAGIGHPQRFFNQLQQAGLQVIPHPFADHHQFTQHDFQFDKPYPILMTEKDAVKCQQFATPNMWYVPAQAIVSPSLADEIDNKLREL